MGVGLIKSVPGTSIAKDSKVISSHHKEATNKEVSSGERTILPQEHKPQHKRNNKLCVAQCLTVSLHHPMHKVSQMTFLFDAKVEMIKQAFNCEICGTT